jgi:hypothetical protein
MRITSTTTPTTPSVDNDVRPRSNVSWNEAKNVSKITFDLRIFAILDSHGRETSLNNGLYHKHITIMNDDRNATIWSITQESSYMLIEVSFTLIDVHSTGLRW